MIKEKVKTEENEKMFSASRHVHALKLKKETFDPGPGEIR